MSTKKRLWFEIWLNNIWVKAELAVMIQGSAPSGDGCNVSIDHVVLGLEDIRVAWLNQIQLFAGWKNGCRDSTTPIRSPFKRGSIGGGNTDTCCTGWDVKTLCKEGRSEVALHALDLLDQCSIKKYHDTYVCILQECINMKTLVEGKKVHAHIVKSEFKPNTFLGNTLLNMYAKCGSVINARQVFDEMPERNVFTWTMMIAGYVQHGHAQEALNLFLKMEGEGVKPDKVTFVSILKACSSQGALEHGKQIHACIVNSGLESDVFVGSTLVDMYAKCGNLKQACQIFNRIPTRNVVTWNAIISGYAKHGHAQESLKLFEQMKQEGVKPDEVTFVSILQACASLGSLEQGKQILAHISSSGYAADVFIGSTLVDMYVKCGRLEHARCVFDKMPKRSVVTWTVMIDGYSQYGLGKEVFRLFNQMQQEGVKPDKVTFISVLNACANLAALEHGKQIHARIVQSEFSSDITVANTLVDMYAKCGSMGHALEVFNKMPQRDVVSWTALIGGYAQHGHAKEAFQLVEQMLCEGVNLHYITFIAILSACSHAGLVEEGHNYFDSMYRDHSITPTAEHYVCMVDLLGRAGHLAEADELIRKMPFQPNAVVWTALLGACRIHGNVQLAKHVAQCILKLEPWNTTAFVMLSNIYAAAGRWDDKTKVLKMMIDKGWKKELGCSHIE